uniref:hypothetical protein n=1 Tax=Chishuiella sp. TaxID=1969467 RepID=UPI0028AEFE88
ISFLLDQKNTPIKIKDYDSLKNAFQQNRTKIEDFYKGNFVQNYLDLFYDQLSNEEKICQKIISSALFKSLFPNIELFRKTTSFCISFPILSIQKPVLFSCEVTYDHQEENVVYTIIKGKSIENELLKDTISEHDSQHNTILNSMKSELLLVYITDKKDKKLQKCKLALKTYHHGAVYSSYQLIIE